MHEFAITNVAVARTRINKRLFIPKLLFLPAILLAPVSQYVYAEDGFWDTTWEVLSLLILMIAVIGRVWTAAYISGRKTHELVDRRALFIDEKSIVLFQHARLPGAGLAFEKLTVALAFVVVFWVLHWPTILAEESKLRNKFGEVYDAYAKSVPRFWPRIGRMKLPAITFSPIAFNRACAALWLHHAGIHIGALD